MLLDNYPGKFCRRQFGGPAAQPAWPAILGNYFRSEGSPLLSMAPNLVPLCGQWSGIWFSAVGYAAESSSPLWLRHCAESLATVQAHFKLAKRSLSFTEFVKRLQLCLKVYLCKHYCLKTILSLLSELLQNQFCLLPFVG
jgi:hypothetical protein